MLAVFAPLAPVVMLRNNSSKRDCVHCESIDPLTEPRGAPATIFALERMQIPFMQIELSLLNMMKTIPLILQYITNIFKYLMINSIKWSTKIQEYQYCTTTVTDRLMCIFCTWNNAV